MASKSYFLKLSSQLPMDTIPSGVSADTPDIDDTNDADDDLPQYGVTNSNQTRHSADDSNSDDSSSGFGDFCGFDLEDDLSDDPDMDDDEMIRPGKTYEYVNFVDPKYANKGLVSGINSSSATSSTRSLKSVINGQNNKQSSRFLSQRSVNDPIAEETEEGSEDEQHNNTPVHYHAHSKQQYELQQKSQPQDNEPKTVTRCFTPSEIQADHHALSTKNLISGRKKVLDERIKKRRYVWKDAKDVDIICLISSPCVRPNSLSTTSQRFNHLSQSTETAVENVHKIFQKPKSMCDVLMDEDEDNMMEYGATLDDEKCTETKSSSKRNVHKSINKKKKKNNKKKKSVATLIRNESINLGQKKGKKKTKNNKKGNNKKTKKQIKASKRNSKSDSVIYKNKNKNAKVESKHNVFNSDGNLHINMLREHDLLQHFDINGSQTLLFDGILCSINHTARYLTVGGNIQNVKNKIKGCKLLHYIGYAQNGQLLLENDDDVGKGQWFDPLKYSNSDSPIIDRMTQCVVIQSPNHMEAAEIFLKLKVKHVIAIKQQKDNFAHHITDFLTQFYFALIESNTTIARAFRTGLKLFEDENAVSSQYRDSILTDFRLLPENQDHELILFRNKLFGDGPPTNKSQKLPPHNSLHAIRPFIGRWNDVYKTMNMIRDKKLSIICSDDGGLGRTAIVTMAARYLWERSKFKGGVFHIKSDFSQRKIHNLADLILHTLSISGVDHYDEIESFHAQSGKRYQNKSKLAVDLLYKYVKSNGNSSICLLLSDFDEFTFSDSAKYSFLCAFIERFENEECAFSEIGSRIIITCRLPFLHQLHLFMDHVYKSLYTQQQQGGDENDTVPTFERSFTTDTGQGHNDLIYGHVPSQKMVKHNAQLIQSSASDYTQSGNVTNGRPASKSAPTNPYDLNNVRGGVEAKKLFTINRFDSNRIRMEYKRGHQVIKALSDSSLIHLFLRMINIASTEPIYTFEKMSKHARMLKLFDAKPFKVKQIAEYVLRTFDDNLSKQQFLDDDADELVFTLEDESDSELEEDDDYDSMCPIEYPGHGIYDDDDKKMDYRPRKSVRLSIDMPQNLHSNASFRIKKKRKSRLVRKVMSIKRIKTSSRLHIHCKSSINSSAFTDLLKNRTSILLKDRTSLLLSPSNRTPSTMLMSPGTTPSKDTIDHLPTIDSMRESVDGISELLSTSKSVNNLHVKNGTFIQHNDMLNNNEQNEEILMESTIVQGDDAAILLTQNSSKQNVHSLSSRQICVDMAVNDMDYTKTFIRQKIKYIYTSSRNKLLRNAKSERNVVHNKNVSNFRMQSPAVQSINSVQMLPKVPEMPKPGSLSKLQSGSEHSYDSNQTEGKIRNYRSQIGLDEGVQSPKSGKRPEHKSKNVSFSSFPNHGKNGHSKNVSFTPSKITTISNNQHQKNVLSTKLSKPNLAFGQNTSMQIDLNTSTYKGLLTPQMSKASIKPSNGRTRSSMISISPPIMEEQVIESHEDKLNKIKERIKAAWPTLDDIVDGFSKFDKKRKAKSNMPSKKTQQPQQQSTYSPYHYVNGNGSSPNHSPRNSLNKVPISNIPQKRFKNMDNVNDEWLDRSTANHGTKHFNINVSSHSFNQLQKKNSLKMNTPPSCTVLVNNQYSNSLSSSNSYHQTPMPDITDRIKQIIQNSEAQKLWLTNGGNCSEFLELDDFMNDLTDLFVQKTKNTYLKFDRLSIGPIFEKFSTDSETLEISANAFVSFYSWFESLCKIIGETPNFWNDEVAANHGFISRENAEKILINRNSGTFLIRFIAPSYNLVISYNDRKKRFARNPVPISHVRLIRNGDCNLYTIATKKKNKNMQRFSLRNIVQTMPELTNIYSTDYQTIPKKKYFF